jgi:uroporphyrinogen decarboxylase
VDAWQRKLLNVTLQARPDIVVDAQWYATTFLSPALYRRFLLPLLKRRADVVHDAGAQFCAIATTNVLPFAECLKDIGVDLLFGVDPIMGSWNLPRAKRELGGAMCLAGGVNGYLTIVDGTPDKVRQAVQDAMRVLAPGGRFILAPVDDVRTEPDSPPGAWDRAWANTLVMVEEWKRLQ